MILFLLKDYIIINKRTKNIRYFSDSFISLLINNNLINEY